VEKMDIATVVGLVLGFLAVALGMMAKHISFGVLLNPAASLIIFAGTIAAVTIAFPAQDLKNLPKLLKIIFGGAKKSGIPELIKTFSKLSEVARRDGLLALEAKVNELDDEFLKSGLMLAIDGQSADFIRDVLNEEIDAMEDRHSIGANIFTQAGTYAPTLGVLGAVLGLIAALGNMDDTDALGAAIAAAFVATLFGIFTGYVMWHPFANKLRMKSKAEVKEKRLVIEGVLSVLEGQPPRLIEQKLSAYLSSSERQLLDKKEEGGN
jgi:chemotaxis protein MotA